MEKLLIFVVLQCLITSDAEGRKDSTPSFYANLRRTLEVLSKLEDDISKPQHSSNEPDDISEVNLKSNTTDENINGTYWQGGDERLTKEQKEAEDYDNAHPELASDALKNPSRKWTKGRDNRVKVPYAFDSSIATGSPTFKVINEAIQKFRELTCIDWVPMSSLPQSTYHVSFTKGRGCYSFIGKIGPNRQFKDSQPLSIGNGCERQLGTVEHEMLHAMGFFHEQSRYDRDEHVIVLINNLIDPRLSGNFNKQSATILTTGDFPYDLDSIMHYHSGAFARQGTNTMLTRVGRRPFSAQRRGFSPIDLKQVKKYYDCQSSEEPGPPPIEEETPKSKICESLSLFGLCNRKVVCSFCKPQCSKVKATFLNLGDVKGKRRCEYWRGKGYCDTNSRFIQWMGKHCLKTCFSKYHPEEEKCRQ